MNKFITAFIMISFFIPAAVYSQDPRAQAECVNMLKPALQSQCSVFFGNDPEKKALCIENIDSETHKQCGRFFEGDNFCSTCTSECIKQYQAADLLRKACLKTCMNNPACK